MSEPTEDALAILRARAYIKKHLGDVCDCEYFDDCIHNAVSLCLQAQQEQAVAQKNRLRAENALAAARKPYTSDALDEFRTDVGYAAYEALLRMMQKGAMA